MARPVFFSDPVHAVLIIGAIVGALSLVAKGERSFMILLSVLLGTFVLYWIIAELMGH